MHPAQLNFAPSPSGDRASKVRWPIAVGLCWSMIYAAISLLMVSSRLFGRNNLLFGADQAEYVHWLGGHVGPAILTIKHPLAALLLFAIGAPARTFARLTEGAMGLSVSQWTEVVSSSCTGGLAIGLFMLFCLRLGLCTRRAALVSTSLASSTGSLLWFSSLEIHSICGLGLCASLVAYTSARRTPLTWPAALTVVGSNITGLFYIIVFAVQAPWLTSPARKVRHVLAVGALVAATLLVQTWIAGTDIQTIVRRDSAASSNYLARSSTLSHSAASAFIHIAFASTISPRPQFPQHWPRSGRRIEGLPFATNWPPHGPPAYWVFAALWAAIFGATLLHCLRTRCHLALVACTSFNLAFFTVFGLPQEQLLYAPMILPLNGAMLAASLVSRHRAARVIETMLWIAVPAAAVNNALLFASILSTYR